MKIGICAGFEMLDAAEEAGFDYIEFNLSALEKLSESEFRELKIRLSGSKIKCEVCNVMLPGGLSLHNDEDEPKIREYIRGAYARASEIGVSIIVFGSGGARRYPDQISRGEALDNLIKHARFFGDEAKKNNLIIAIEPLNKNECNILNGIGESFEFINGVNHENVKLLADFYHMRADGEDIKIIEKTSGLVHTHIARGEGRTVPLSEDEDIYADFFAALKNIGYAGRMSVEGRAVNFPEDLQKSCGFLKKLGSEGA